MGKRKSLSLSALLILAMLSEVRSWITPGFCHTYACPEFTVVHKYDDFEERMYVETQWMTANVQNTDIYQLSEGFGKLDMFCKGKNVDGRSVYSKTWPALITVTEMENGSDSASVSWFFTPDTELPKPLDTSISEEVRPAGIVYVRSFSGMADQRKALYNTNELRQALTLAGKSFEGRRHRTVSCNTWPALVTARQGEDGTETVSFSRFFPPDTVLPKPRDASISNEVRPAGIVYVRAFSGMVDRQKALHFTDKLREALIQGNVCFESLRQTLAVYNYPWDLHEHHNRTVSCNTWPALVTARQGEDGTETVSFSRFFPPDTELPKPRDASISKEVRPAGIVYVRAFSGMADRQKALHFTDKLREALTQGNVSFESLRQTLAVYNYPWDLHEHHSEIWINAA
ncbi:hypothetical protein NHX12_022262 [Muraenolepis orangiensis]|uniref:Heme-binding protein 2 n=1 Tax=Muraenolepis orangiensis TaxID=630683 RepID=A0A9Q0IU21_9TELE|nr:hypothetical protein NHX12_022262 [Muraenolepis orangiensis]